MTPVNLSPPPSPFQLADQKDEQHLHLYLRSCCSLSCDSTFQDQRMIKLEDSQQHDQKVDQYCIAHGGSSNEQVMNNKTREVGEGSLNDNDSSSKWMSSKMRLMQKMMNSDCTETDESSVKITQTLQYQAQLHRGNNEVIGSFNNSNKTVRVCTDCNTTTTPLWRSGPRGPKSLCNACGIRQRKARRATEAAAAAGNGTIVATDNPCTKVKLHSKEKKWRTNHAAQCKKQCKSPDPPHHLGQRKLFFKDFALSLSKNSDLKPVFPQDVEEAAILLMELSCGFIQS